MRAADVRRARRVLSVVCIALVVPLLATCAVGDFFGPSGGWRAGTTAHQLTVGALNRTFLLHVPLHQSQSASGTLRPYPLLILLHGSSSTGADIRHASGMDSLSEVDHFIVVYPDGYQGAGGLFPSDWNAGTCCGAAARENIDDLGFLAGIIDEVSKKLPVDARRVYVAGFSDGGRMAYHSACQLAARIAAIGVVSGSLRDDACAPRVPVPVLAIHGTGDAEVPFDDDALTAPPAPVPAAASALPSSVQFWAAEDRCTTATVTQPAADVTLTTMGACVSDVVFYAITGGSHAWPGEPDGAGSEPPMSELAASKVIVQFLLHHARK
jgi:polyhydroxybutyrate depolymerase